MAGQVIDVNPVPPALLPFLDGKRAEVVVETDEELAIVPELVEKAIARRTKPRRKRIKPPTDDETPTVPVICPGGTVVCIGGGPSLTTEDVEYCRGKATVVAINDAYRLAPWADVLYAADNKWWRWHGGVPDFKGLKFTLHPEAGRWPDVKVLQQTGERGIEVEPTGLRAGWNGGYQAINLAIHLGASRVLLLGYDMQRGSNGESHWFGAHPDGSESPYATFRERFKDLVGPLAQLGVTVINCSRETALETFPRMPLREALP